MDGSKYCVKLMCITRVLMSKRVNEIDNGKKGNAKKKGLE